MKQRLEKLKEELAAQKAMYDNKLSEYLHYKKSYYEALYCKEQIHKARKEVIECTLTFYIGETLNHVFPMLRDKNSTKVYYPDSINDLKKCDKEPIIDRYDIQDPEEMFIHGKILMNGDSIKEMLTIEVDNDKYKYTIADRVDRIECLETYIAETTSDSDRILMREDLAYLNSSKEELLFEAVSTNGFIAKDVDPDRFNQICEEITDDNN